MAYYWYQSDPQLYQDGSGRLYWRGKVQPAGKGGMVWDIMLIYKNTHPHAEEGEYGGSVQILPLSPRLKDIAQKTMPLMEKAYGSYENAAAHGFGLGLPHIYRSNFGRDEEYFICTADPKYFKAGQNRSTTAASALSWACKWILLCEMWLNGEIGDDVALEGNY